jgi:hypothetical protein
MRLHPAPNDDFVVVGCKGLWLYPEDSIEKTDYRAIFGGSAPSRHRDACFDEVSLDEIYADDHYRHLDLSVTQLAEDGMSWPRVKFKLFENRGECGVEFRTGENWPKFFRVWPGAQVDRFGPVHTIVGAEAFAEAVASAPHEDDRRLLAALMDLLVPIVRTLGGRGDISPSEVAQWIETARKLQAGMV